MSDRPGFYQQRDRRTAEYGIDPSLLEAPVAMCVSDDAAASRPGQVAAMALINMLARIHRSIMVMAPPSPVIARALVPGDDLVDVIVATARAIDPFIEIEVVGRPPPDTPCIGIGENLPRGFPIYVGAEGAVATVADEPQPISPGDSSALGSGLSVCLGAADLLHLVTSGRAAGPRRVSIWGFGEGEARRGQKLRSPL